MNTYYICGKCGNLVTNEFEVFCHNFYRLHLPRRESIILCENCQKDFKKWLEEDDV